LTKATEKSIASIKESKKDGINAEKKAASKLDSKLAGVEAKQVLADKKVLASAEKRKSTDANKLAGAQKKAKATLQARASDEKDASKLKKDKIQLKQKLTLGKAEKSGEMTVKEHQAAFTKAMTELEKHEGNLSAAQQAVAKQTASSKKQSKKRKGDEQKTAKLESKLNAARSNAAEAEKDAAQVANKVSKADAAVKSSLVKKVQAQKVKKQAVAKEKSAERKEEKESVKAKIAKKKEEATKDIMKEEKAVLSVDMAEQQLKTAKKEPPCPDGTGAESQKEQAKDQLKLAKQEEKVTAENVKKAAKSIDQAKSKDQISKVKSVQDKEESAASKLDETAKKASKAITPEDQSKAQQNLKQAKKAEKKQESNAIAVMKKVLKIVKSDKKDDDKVVDIASAAASGAIRTADKVSSKEKLKVAKTTDRAATAEVEEVQSKEEEIKMTSAKARQVEAARDMDAAAVNAAKAGTNSEKAKAKQQMKEGREVLTKEARIIQKVAGQQAKDGMHCGNGKLDHKEKACDDGNTEDGDGCTAKCQVEAFYSCLGGSKTSRSLCSICGDGQVTGWEACDDGNKEGGDGCSGKCTIEANYMCFQPEAKQIPSPQLGKSTCKRSTQQEWAKKQDLSNSVQCDSCDMLTAKRDFAILNPFTGTGKCLPRLPQTLSGPKSAQVLLHEERSQGTSLTSPPRAITRTSKFMTCPRKVGQVPTPASATDAPTAYAVCMNVKHKLCSRNGGDIAKGVWLKGECVVKSKTKCSKVCAEARFCKFGASGKGKLVQQEHGKRLHPDGRVCCFDDCSVPKSWGVKLSPELWCMSVALANGM